VATAEPLALLTDESNRRRRRSPRIFQPQGSRRAAREGRAVGEITLPWAFGWDVQQPGTAAVTMLLAPLERGTEPSP
jgi:hypothetical protein